MSPTKALLVMNGSARGIVDLSLGRWDGPKLTGDRRAALGDDDGTVPGRCESSIEMRQDLLGAAHGVSRNGCEGKGDARHRELSAGTQIRGHAPANVVQPLGSAI